MFALSLLFSTTNHKTSHTELGFVLILLLSHFRSLCCDRGLLVSLCCATWNLIPIVWDHVFDFKMDRSSCISLIILLSPIFTAIYGQYAAPRQNGGSGYGGGGGGGGGYGGQSSGYSGGGYGQFNMGGGGGGNGYSSSGYSQQGGQEGYSGSGQGGYSGGGGGGQGGYGQGQGLSGGSGRGMDNGNPLNRLNPNYLGPRPDYCKRPTGQFSVPNDCTSFYNCHENIAWIQKCPEGLGFNEQAYQCDYAEVTGCQAAAAAAAAASARLQAQANSYGSSGGNYGSGSGYSSGQSGYSGGGNQNYGSMGGGSGYSGSMGGGSGYSGSMGGGSGYSGSMGGGSGYSGSGGSGYGGSSSSGGYGQNMYGSASENAAPRISEFGSSSNGASNGNGLASLATGSSSNGANGGDQGFPATPPPISLCTPEQAMQISASSYANEVMPNIQNSQSHGQATQQGPLSSPIMDEADTAMSTVYGPSGPSSGQAFCQPCREPGVTCSNRPEARCFDDVCGGCRARFFERDNGSGPFVEVTSMCSSSGTA